MAIKCTVTTDLQAKDTKHAIEEWNNKHFQNYVEHSCLHSD